MNDLQNTVLLLQQMVAEKRWEEELLPIAKQIVEDLSIEQESNRDFIVSIQDYYETLWKRARWEIKTKVIKTWFRDIDTRLYWVFAWEITTIAARTWVGKTTLWIDMALNMLEHHKVGFITLEMTKEDMLDRMMSRECWIYLGSFYSDWFNQRDIERLKKYGWQAKEKINRLMLAYGCFNIDDIIATMNTMTDAWCEVIFIDWLWMINAPWNKRNEQMHWIMTALKDFAIDKNIALVVMQQLNRQIDSITRDDPELYDIADSSAIEHISAPVLILWKKKDEKTDETFCTIFKARRINEEAKLQCKEMAEAQWKKWQEVFYKIVFKDDLWHCSFRDFSPDLPTNNYQQWTKPF